MITDYNRLSGLDKVAILFSVLGESLAVKMVKGLAEADLRRIRARVREMESVSSSVKKKVVDQFYLAFISRKLEDETGGDTKRPFLFLENLADEQLAALLEVEEPRIIAMALAQVPTNRQVFVMNRLTPEPNGRFSWKWATWGMSLWKRWSMWPPIWKESLTSFPGVWTSPGEAVRMWLTFLSS